MKRKIDQTEEPEVAATPTKKPSETKATWDNLGLSPRLLQGVAQLNWHNPTDIQAKAVPLALEGRDILAKSGTGTGKTAAYVLPVLEKVLQRKEKETKGAAAATSVLMLVPTRELADQVHRSIESLAAFCAKDIQAVKLTDKVSTTVQRALLSANPDIVISTPARAWDNVSSSALSLANLTHLVLDEADLVLSYGYKEDLQNVARSLPKGVQTILMSATLTPEVDTVKGLFCRNPALLDLEQPEAEGDGITQFVVKCAEDEKFLLIYVIFKLKLIQGKALVFCHDVDRSYKLKLYFEQFGIRSCILNAELPVNSRLHVVDEFNKGVYDILIASDDNEVVGDESQEDEGEEETTEEPKKEAKKSKKKQQQQQQRASRKDKEYGVSRGIDFKNVAAVINFDLPTSAKSYTHRIGRTARAGQRGMALSFVIPAQHYRGHPPSSVESAEHDEKILARIEKQQAKKGKEVKPYHFDMAQVSAFKYRMDDALRAVTRVAVREARTRELRQELIKSDKLRRHFEENPQELAHLRHDGELRAARMQPHLRHVPDYLLPADGKKGLTADEVGFVPLRKKNDRRNSSRRAGGKKNSNRVFKVGRKKSDPLKSFKAKAAKK
ncbi:hypothetical protein VDGE_06557 [Verticillium dahliae]|uniref:RNA helicase n=1 Tax=Verticillium dahliae TaxID=27337 RepID=A0A444S2G6_VERDA|nr:hypothetical protein VDGE_06557 [Verticillium dahliae]